MVFTIGLLGLGTVGTGTAEIILDSEGRNPLLQEIKIKFDEFCTLPGLARLLAYFYRHYEEIFAQTKTHLKHFKKIEIEIKKK